MKAVVELLLLSMCWRQEGGILGFLDMCKLGKRFCLLRDAVEIKGFLFFIYFSGAGEERYLGV